MFSYFSSRFGNIATVKGQEQWVYLEGSFKKTQWVKNCNIKSLGQGINSSIADCYATTKAGSHVVHGAEYCSKSKAKGVKCNWN